MHSLNRNTYYSSGWSEKCTQTINTSNVPRDDLNACIENEEAVRAMNEKGNITNAITYMTRGAAVFFPIEINFN